MTTLEAQAAQAWLDARFAEEWPQHSRLWSVTVFPRPMIQALLPHGDDACTGLCR